MNISLNKLISVSPPFLCPIPLSLATSTYASRPWCTKLTQPLSYSSTLISRPNSQGRKLLAFLLKVSGVGPLTAGLVRGLILTF
jgi:hypothetical protein